MHWLVYFYRSLTWRERVAAAAAVLLLATGVLGLGIAAYLDSTRAVASAGGVYREGMVGQPAYVNPVIADSSADKSLTRLLFASVTDLADHIETADGGRTYKVHLKEGLRWSDGEELTSDDVIFTVDQIKNPDTASPLATAWQGVDASRASKLEVDFSLPQPYVFFGDTLSALRVLPKHIYAEIPPANWKLSDYNTRPVGSGPYVFASRTVEPDGFITVYRLRANPNAVAGAPYLSEIDLSFYRNQQDLVQAFNSGAVDGLFATDPGDLAAVKRPYHSTVFQTPTYYAVFWNQSANTALAADEVRQALGLAVDRNALVSKILGVYGASSTDPFSPAYLPPLAASSSPAAAEALLQKRGWQAGPDGVLAKTVGKANVRLSFTLTVPDVPFLVQTAEALAEDWQAIGAEVEIQKMPLESVLAGPIKNRTYEALLYGNTLTLSGDAYAFWHSSERLYPGLNLALYQNSQADHLLETIRQENDPAKRLGEMDLLRQMITAVNPALFLFAPAPVYATNRNIQGITPELLTDAADRFQNVGSWYTETRRVFR